METSLRKQILSLLKTKPIETVLSEVRNFPPRQAASALISGLCHTNPTLKWHAVSALGVAMALLAEEDMEAAREIMRRLMWSLNDESGGVGWGTPEALGEIMAVHHGLAEEYAFSLVAYIRKDASYLELPALQRGLIWGIGRVAEADPDLLKKFDAPFHLLPCLDSQDPEVRGLAARAIGLLRFKEAKEKLATLENDSGEFILYGKEGLRKLTVGALAKEASESLFLNEVV
jgi:hypothetical protein